VTVVKVEPRHVMALRQLTDQPISVCRAALVEAGNDLAAVVRRLRESPCGLYANDTEVAAVFAAHGVVYTPEVYKPVILPDSEVVAELTAGGIALSDRIIIGGLICSASACGQLTAMLIDDPDLAASALAYLRRTGALEYPSMQAYRERG
jgi:hypothetical protein